MWQLRAVTRPRRTRNLLLAVLVTPALVLGVGACDGTPAAPPHPQTITGKGTPYGDLLVPKLTASVTDGAVGVTVDAPVTVSAEDGVLGAITMTNGDGATVAGRLSPDGLRWTTTEPLGYNNEVHAQRAVPRPWRCDEPVDDVPDAFAREPDDALPAAQ
ncbi:MAG: hypothetical protein QOI01_3747 [Mycobacterium sp.]|nr:hypothetical protein [Mycobacterium sp.]